MNIFSSAQMIVTLIIIGVIAFFAYDYNHSKKELAKTKATLYEQVVANKQLREDFDTYKHNQDNVNAILSSQKSIVLKETAIKDSIKNVPVKSNNHPFADDPGLLERARRMRDYQIQQAATIK